MRDLTVTEERLMRALGQAATIHSSLPPAHPNDRAEFVAAIHAAQNIVLARPATEQFQQRRQERTDGSDDRRPNAAAARVEDIRPSREHPR